MVDKLLEDILNDKSKFNEKIKLDKILPKFKDTDDKILYCIKNEIKVPKELIEEQLGDIYDVFEFVEEECTKLPSEFRYRDDGETPILEHLYKTTGILDGTGRLSKSVGLLHDFLETKFRKKYNDLNSQKYIFDKEFEKTDEDVDYIIDTIISEKPKKIEDLRDSDELKDNLKRIIKTYNFESFKDFKNLKKNDFLEYYQQLQKLIQKKFGIDVLNHLNIVTNYYDIDIFYDLDIKERKEISEKWLIERHEYLSGLSLQRKKKMINFMLFIDDVIDFSFYLYEKKKDEEDKFGYKNSLASIYVELGDKIHNIMTAYPTSLEKKNVIIKKIEYILNSLIPYIEDFSSKGTKLSQTQRLVQRLIDETDKQLEKIIDDIKEREIEKDKLDYWKNIQDNFINKYGNIRGKLYNDYINTIISSLKENGLNKNIWLNRLLTEIDSCEKNLKRDNPIKYSINPISRSYEFILKLNSLIKDIDPDKKSRIFKKTKELFFKSYIESKKRWIEANYLYNTKEGGKKEYTDTKSILQSLKISFYNMKKFYE